jgi:hypothetical protein
VINGKRARKQIQNLEFDDLESISDGDIVSVKDSVIGKPKKSSNGKVKREVIISCHRTVLNLQPRHERRKSTEHSPGSPEPSLNHLVSLPC